MSRRNHSPRQLTLALRSMPRWGGRREGAGRKPGLDARDPHRARAALAARFPCHVTLKVRRGLPSLRAVRLARELERSLAAACEQERFRVAQYSVQPDHVHLIVEARSRRDLSCGMKSIGARLARAVNRVFRRRGRVLADRYHLHVLRTPREVRHALAYVLLNARHDHCRQGKRRVTWAVHSRQAIWPPSRCARSCLSPAIWQVNGEVRDEAVDDSCDGPRRGERVPAECVRSLGEQSCSDAVCSRWDLRRPEQ